MVDGKGRVERIPYELCVLVSLRDALRRREIWVVGANRSRNPEDDLPADFEDNRDVHYAAIRQPQDAGEFIDALQGKLRTSLDRFERALAEGTTGGVAIVNKHGEPWIRVSPPEKQEEPESLVAIKGEIERRWGPRTRTSSTAKTATWPVRTGRARRCPCSPCTCSSPPWCTSTRC